MAGEIARWRDRCPMTVRCPECGKAFGATVLFRRHTIQGHDPYQGGRVPGCVVAGVLVVLLGVPIAMLFVLMAWVVSR